MRHLENWMKKKMGTVGIEHTSTRMKVVSAENFLPSLTFLGAGVVKLKGLRQDRGKTRG